jgi:hypothetical protein
MIQNKTIEIDSVETKMASTGNVKYIITSGKDKFYFYKIHKGNKSPAYESYEGMESAGRVKKGAVVAIGYTEEDKEFTNNKGEVIKYKDRCIVSIREADGLDTAQNPPQAKSPRSEAPVRSQGKPETDWDQIAIGKCQTVFLAAYLQAGNTFVDAKLQAVQARKLAELVVYGTQQEELPTINQDDDPAGEFNAMVNEPSIEAFGEDIPY